MADFLEVSLDKLMGRKCPGSEVLEEDRRAAQKRANALDQMLAEESADDWSGAPRPKKKPKARSKKAKRKKS